MKVLIVCSRRSYATYSQCMAPFIYDQITAIHRLRPDIVFEVFYVAGGRSGWLYVQAIEALRKKIRAYQPDVVHAHVGLCCALTCFVVRYLMHSSLPIVSTFHGSDINEPRLRKVSQWAIKRSTHSIFVSPMLYTLAGSPKNGVVIPCGVDTELFRPMDKVACREALHLLPERKYVLFSKQYTDTVKNYPLTRAALDLLGEEVVLIEFYGFSREQVPMVYNAVDACIMTSFREGSPQFAKEAVACGCPMVSVDVGDVRQIVQGVPNCRIVPYEANAIAEELRDCIAIGHMQETMLPMPYQQATIINQIITLYENL